MQQTAEVNLYGFIHVMWTATLLGVATFILLISSFLSFLLSLSTFSAFLFLHLYTFLFLFCFCFVSRTGEREEISKDLKIHSFTVFVKMLVQNLHIFLSLFSMRKAEVPQHKPWSIFPAAADWREHCQDICRGVCRSGCSYEHTILILRFFKGLQIKSEWTSCWARWLAGL